MSKQRESATEKKERVTLRTLILANVVAALAMLTAGVIVLWATGLLASMLDFLF